MRPEIGELWKWVDYKDNNIYLILSLPNTIGVTRVLCLNTGNIEHSTFSPERMPYWKKVG